MFDRLVSSQLVPRYDDAVQRLIPGKLIATNMNSLPIDPAIELSGFDLPEAAGRWSLGYSFSIAFDWPENADTLDLVANFGAYFLPAGHLSMRVFLNGEDAGEMVFKAGSIHHEFRYTLKGLPKGKKVVMTCLLFDPQSPSEAGLYEDKRRLGVVLESFGVMPREEARQFFNNQNILDQLVEHGQGWHDKDALLWAEDDCATIEIPLDGICSPHVQVRLGVQSLLPQKDVLVEIEGVPHRFDLPHAGDVIIEVPLTPLGNTLTLSFSEYDFAVPDEVIDNGDTRRIGLGLAHLCLEYLISNRTT